MKKEKKETKMTAIVTGEAGAEEVAKAQTADIAADVPEMSPEQIEFARMTMRKEFNERFSKWAIIEDENADDDFIAQTKKDLDDEVELNKNRKFNIGGHEDGIALRTAEFLKEWNENFNHWEKGMWRGIIRFNIVISDILKDLQENPEKDIEIDYPTLIFLYNSMMQPSGIGLESARLIARFENYNEETDGPFEEDVPVTYSGVLEKIKHHVDGLASVDKKINILHQRYNLALAGLRMTLKISEIEEFVEFNNAITNAGVEQATEETVNPEKTEKK